MTSLELNQKFPAVRLTDIDGEGVEFPRIFSLARATVVFFYRGRW